MSFRTQTNTVHVSGDHRNLVEGKTILIFDDFTTSGKSLDWARNLLYEAGAARVVGLTIGKYGYKPLTEIYEPKGIDIAPYVLGTYEDSNFRKILYDMRHNPSAYEVVRTSFCRYAKGEALPP